MSRRIPDDDRLDEAIRAVIRTNRQIESQTAMTRLVLKELRKEDENYSVGGERIRRVATERNLLRIEIDYNVHDDASSPDLCPVCGFPMETVNNATLDGMEVDVGRKCGRCTYATGLRRRTPGRYTFSIVRSSRESMDSSDRTAVVRDAEKLIRKAASMIESITKGTEHGRKGKRCASGIRKTISSKKDGDSLANLVKDMEHPDPEWTRPLASVKNGNRKDI